MEGCALLRRGWPAAGGRDNTVDTATGEQSTDETTGTEGLAPDTRQMDRECDDTQSLP